MWLAVQVAAEGMKLMVGGLGPLVSDMLSPKADLEAVKEIEQPYPDLAEQKKQWIAYLASKKHSKHDDDDDDPDEDDDDDEPKAKKLN